MRGILLATTILAGAAALPTPAAAEGGPIRLGLAGYMEGFVGWASQSSGPGPDGVLGTADDAPGAGRRNTGFFRKGEIFFSGDTILDNGLKVGAHVALQAVDCTDQIDLSYIWFEHRLGRMEVGKQNAAPHLMWQGAPVPAPGLGVNTPDFLAVNSANAAGVGNLIPTPTTYLATANFETVNYFTPRIAGIQLGLSYSPNSCQAGNAGTSACGGSYAGMFPSNLPQLYDLYGLAASYVTQFNGVDLGAYAGYYHGRSGVAKGPAGTPTDDQGQWGVGGSLGYRGFTLGASYRQTDSPGGIVAAKRHDWNAGLSYATGPWTFGLQYAQSEASLQARTDDFKGGGAGAAYTLGPGIELVAGVQYFDWGTNATNPAIRTPATNQAWNVMLGTVVRF